MRRSPFDGLRVTGVLARDVVASNGYNFEAAAASTSQRRLPLVGWMSWAG